MIYYAIEPASICLFPDACFSHSKIQFLKDSPAPYHRGLKALNFAVRPPDIRKRRLYQHNNGSVKRKNPPDTAKLF
ncbi:hypothetical protein [Thiolapillus sp.]|uniref:hypothetical protein n=1 Tax=Thiolapillus sp. TaxID=2017437 RepID=UPI003AF6FAA1